MKRYLFVIVMLISMYSLSAQNALWNQVAELEKQSLPKSALEVVNRIYAEARAKGDGPELIKALIYQLKYETAIDQDRLPDWILEIETLAQKDTRPAEQAVLYSYLSELYSLYYQAHNYDINQRTAIQADSDTDFPADLREWTGNLFIRKIVDSAQRSIAPAKILQADDALQYKTILTEGESSRKLRPTLYDLLMYRAIDRLNNLAQNRQTQNYFPQTKLSDPADFEPVKTFVNLPVTAEKYNLVPQILNLYQQLLAFRLQTASGNQDLALLMVDLDRLDFVYHQTQTDAAEKNYLDALNTLKQQYASSEYCVEILYKEVLYYYANQQEKEQQEKIYALCREGIEKYPNYNRIGLLQNVCNQVTQGYWEAQSESVVYPGHDLELSLNYRNLSQLTIEIYRIQAEASAYLSSSASLYRNQGRLVETKKIDLTSPLPYEIYDTIIKIPMKELGIYEYVIYADSKKLDIVNKPFSVSRLAAIARTTDGKREFLVTDRLTGKPVEGAQIHLYKRNRNNSEQSAVQTVTTNALGLAVSDGDINMEYYTASFQEDTALLLSGTPWISNYRQKENTRQTLNLFTDRSLYRPGQTVYFKGIAYELGKNVQHAIPDKSYTLTLYDPNYKEIAKKTFKTNAFGSISGEFVIPQGLLNGYFLLQSDPDGASAGIQVEEYKRPTFDIRFDPNEQTYSLGDQVVVKGKVQTFSGINLQNAEVQYRITRQDHWLLGRMMRRNPVQTAEGQVQTNNDGSFSLTFPADRAFEDKERKNVYYTYTIEASVSDTNGETQSAQTSMAIGEKSMYLTIEGLQEVNAKEKLPDIRIDAWNLNARPVTAKGTYSIYKLKSNRPDVLDAPSGDWTTDQKVFSGDFESAKPIAIAAMKSWASGRYRMVVQSKDDQEREVEAQQDFTLASTQDKRPPVPVSEWIMQTKTECAVGETAEIIYGSAAKNVYVLYEIFQNDKKISASRFVLNNENRKITIPFLESYGDGISACFTFIKDKKVHFETVLITKKQPDESLTLQMEVFRDRLLPGQSEEWKISVKNADKKPVSAEILAAMYDASLDKIKEHNWYFNPSRSLSLATPYWQSEDIVNILHDSRSLPEKNVNYPAFTFDTFNWFGWNISYPMLRGGIRNSMSYSKASGMDVADIAEDEMIAESAVMDRANAVPAPKAKAASQTEEAAESPVQIRQNFNETSFFYPQLKTNEAGETLIAFTVPESNTTWKFMGLAHTKDLKFGQIMKEAISQKQLMVTPNLPRFMRESDQMTIATNISNLSESAIDGTVRIECFDPNTGQPAISIDKATQNFSLETGKTTAVTWSFQVPAGIEITAVKIVAQSPNFSDGEQHLIPVLPNRMLVTESLPLYISGGQTKTFTFNQMKENHSPTLENFRLTLEFTSNPVWYAVQALPAMQTPSSDNVVSWFAAFYSDILATHIANSTPKIKSMIDIWTKQGGTKETLLSNLEKNQELKAVLSEETPWVTEAADETEQKQRLALLFDLNRSQSLTRTAIDKLQSLQQYEGGWVWFNGMRASVPLTQWILYGLGQLSRLHALQPGDDVQTMQLQAVQFIDRQFKQHYLDMQKNNPKWKTETQMISTYELEYLFVRSYYKDIPLIDVAEAVKFYTGLTDKYWTKNTRLYDRAIAAIILQRSGYAQTANAIVKSLREHASHREDLGMFWANNDTHAFMFQSATCVQTFIMQSFEEIGTSSQEMDEMKLWLLKQKQTQVWESVPATVNAINALLQTGTNWLVETRHATSLQLGGKTIDTQSSEAGTGYIKVVKNAQEFNPSQDASVTVTQTGNAPGWGALYWQYFENLDKIAAARNGLSVEKNLFVERINPAGKILEPITEDRPIKIGDKVTVRLTVRADRDMEYVCLKDLRAACFEPAESLSGIQWKQNVVYYQTMKDASAQFYLYNLPKGTYVFEYALYAAAAGDYSNGTATIQCLYAPEFVAHTSGERVHVKTP